MWGIPLHIAKIKTTASGGEARRGYFRSDSEGLDHSRTAFLVSTVTGAAWCGGNVTVVCAVKCHQCSVERRERHRSSCGRMSPVQRGVEGMSPQFVRLDASSIPDQEKWYATVKG